MRWLNSVLIALFLAAAPAAAEERAAAATPAAPVQKDQVFKNDSCQCCLKWMAYMMQNGFALEGKDISNSERTRLRACR